MEFLHPCQLEIQVKLCAGVYPINAVAQNFTIMNQQGQVIYQHGTSGSLIIVRGVECISVLGPNGEVRVRELQTNSQTRFYRKTSR